MKKNAPASDVDSVPSPLAPGPSSLLLSHLRRWRREWLVKRLSRGVALLAAVALVAIAAAAALDRFWPISQPWREVAWASGLAGLIAGVYLWALRPWLYFDWACVFDAAQARFPELAPYLKTAWELAENGGGPYVSRELAQAHRLKTEELLVHLPERPLFGWEISRRQIAWTVAAAIALPWLLRSSDFSRQRILRPWADPSLEEWVSVSPGDASVPWGRPVVISVRWPLSVPPARRPRDLRLDLKTAQGWRAAAWDHAGLTAASFSIEELTEPMRYRLSWRGVQSREYGLVPVLEPDFSSLRADIQGPAPEIVVLSPAEPLKVPRGSVVTVTGRPNQPLERAFLSVSLMDHPLEMAPTAAGEYDARFDAQQDATFSISLKSADGRVNAHPLTYRLQVLEIPPPTVSLLSPLQPVQADPSESLPISYSARAQAGLDRIVLLAEPGRVRKEIVLNEFERGRIDFLGDYLLPLEGLPFGTVRFKLEAVDRASPKRSVFSEVGTIEIVDFRGRHRRAEALWDQALKSLEELRALDPAARQALEAAAVSQAEKLWPSLQNGWKQSSEDLDRLVQSLSNDPYANPGVEAELGPLNQAFKSAGIPALDSAAKNWRQGDWPRAREGYGKASRLLDAAHRALKEGKTVQGLDDFYAESGRMSQESGELRQMLGDKAREGGAASAAETEKMRAAVAGLEQKLEALRRELENLPKAAEGQELSQSPRYSLPVDSALDEARAISQAIGRGDWKSAASLARKLSEDIQSLEQALADSAQSAGASGLAAETSQELQKIQRLWADVLRGQAGVLDRTRGLQDERAKRKVEGQKSLLDELAVRQAAVIQKASPPDSGVAADVVTDMSQVEAEFKARTLSESPRLLVLIASRLDDQAAARPERQNFYGSLAGEERDILAAIQKGPPETEEPAELRQPVSDDQKRTRGKTSELENDLEALSSAAPLPEGTLERVSSAQRSQQEAVAALESGDIASALAEEGKALNDLQQGLHSLGEAAQKELEMAASAGQVFQRSEASGGAAGGPAGAKIAPVPLPSSKDYYPPQEIRKELKRSLEENRPKDYDSLIKDYFRRISQ